MKEKAREACHSFHLGGSTPPHLDAPKGSYMYPGGAFGVRNSKAGSQNPEEIWIRSSVAIVRHSVAYILYSFSIHHSLSECNADHALAGSFTMCAVRLPSGLGSQVEYQR